MAVLMPLNEASLRAALTAVRAVGGQHRPLAEIAAGATSALAAAPSGLTAAGAASFLATCGQESAYWRTTTEYGKPGSLRYDPYRGRGYVQVTWVENYRKFGQWCQQRGLVPDPDVFVRTPTLLADAKWAWLTAVWYFAANGLWSYANRGDHYAVSQGVNRGPKAIGTSKVPSHWPERDAMYQAFLKAGPALLPSAPVDDGRRRRQQQLLVA